MPSLTRKQNPESKSKVQIDALRGVCRENGQVHAGMQNPESKSKVQIDALRGTFAISDEHDENAESGIQIQSPDGRPQGHLDQLRQGVNGGGRVQNLSTEYRFFAYRSLLQGVTTLAASRSQHVRGRSESSVEPRVSAPRPACIEPSLHATAHSSDGSDGRDGVGDGIIRGSASSAFPPASRRGSSVACARTPRAHDLGRRASALERTSRAA